MIFKKTIRKIILNVIFSIRKDLDVTSKRVEFDDNLSKILKEMKIIDKDQLGQLIRFYGHHLDKATKCENKSEGRGDERKDVLERALKEWKRREYEFGPDKEWANKILERFYIWQSGENKLIDPPCDDLKTNCELFSVIRERRSIRFWKKKNVEREKIEKIISFATYSPTSCNRKPWHFFVVENDINNVFEGDSTNQSMLEKVPVIIYLGVDERLYPEVYAPAIDAGIVLQCIVMTAHALGLGSCLMYQAESADQDKLKTQLNIPNYYTIYCAVLLGYPNEKSIAPGIMPLEEVCTFQS